MASVVTRANGVRHIKFLDQHGKERQLHLGTRFSAAQAKTIAANIDRIVAAQILGDAPGRDALEWLRGLGDMLRNRLAHLGLCGERSSSTLGEFLDAYIANRPVDESTKDSYRNVRRELVEYFGANVALRDITAGAAENFKARLASHHGHAQATINRRCSIAAQFFRHALRSRLVDENPFEGLGGAVQANRERFRFVAAAVVESVIAACSHPDAGLALALARYAGLRIPSEAIWLRWGDLSDDGTRLTVRCPKTAHHAGRDIRVVPIFPELVPHLEAAQQRSVESGTVYMLARREPLWTCASLTKRVVAALVALGASPWPKLWVNLRATRATELRRDFPGHVVAAWMGHTVAISERHYLNVTDEDYNRAVDPGNLHHGLHRQGAETGGTARNATHADERNPQEFPRDSAQCRDVPQGPMGVTGL